MGPLRKKKNVDPKAALFGLSSGRSSRGSRSARNKSSPHKQRSHRGRGRGRPRRTSRQVDNRRDTDSTRTGRLSTSRGQSVRNKRSRSSRRSSSISFSKEMPLSLVSSTGSKRSRRSQSSGTVSDRERNSVGRENEHPYSSISTRSSSSLKGKGSRSSQRIVQLQRKVEVDECPRSPRERGLTLRKRRRHPKAPISNGSASPSSSSSKRSKVSSPRGHRHSPKRRKSSTQEKITSKRAPKSHRSRNPIPPPPASSSTNAIPSLPSTPRPPTSLPSIEENPLDSFFVINENPTEYRALKNGQVDKNEVIVHPRALRRNSIAFMQPHFLSANSVQDYPGITRAAPNNFAKGVSIGYLKINAKTVKPATLVQSAKVVYWVIKGVITVKSVGGYYKKEGRQYLYGKEFTPGTCILIPNNTVYIMENWTDTDVLLSYCFVRAAENVKEERGISSRE